MEGEPLVALLAREQRTKRPKPSKLRNGRDRRAVDAIVERLRAGGTTALLWCRNIGPHRNPRCRRVSADVRHAPSLVVAHIAGGPQALLRAVEGAEDDADAGAR
jgi:N-acetylmuramic acid 6-phosphate etherase